MPVHSRGGSNRQRPSQDQRAEVKEIGVGAFSIRVIRGRCCGSYLPVDVRFASKAAEVLCCREMS